MVSHKFKLEFQDGAARGGGNHLRNILKSFKKLEFQDLADQIPAETAADYHVITAVRDPLTRFALGVMEVHKRWHDKKVDTEDFVGSQKVAEGEGPTSTTFLKGILEDMQRYVWP